MNRGELQKLKEKLNTQTKMLTQLTTGLGSIASSWEMNYTINSITTIEKNKQNTIEEILSKEKEWEMIINKYSCKNSEIKVLQKNEEKFMKEKYEKKSKKEIAEAEHLSLLSKLYD